MIIIFHLYCIKYRVWKPVKSTEIPNPMRFSHWNHRSRYTYSVLNLFWHLGMLFLGIIKKCERLRDFGSYRTADWSQSMFCLKGLRSGNFFFVKSWAIVPWWTSKKIFLAWDLFWVCFDHFYFFQRISNRLQRTSNWHRGFIYVIAVS